MPQPPAPTKEAEAAVPRADTLSTVPTLTRVQAATVDVITFCISCRAAQNGQQVWESPSVLSFGPCRSAEQQSGR